MLTKPLNYKLGKSANKTLLRVRFHDYWVRKRPETWCLFSRFSLYVSSCSSPFSIERCDKPLVLGYLEWEEMYECQYYSSRILNAYPWQLQRTNLTNVPFTGHSSTRVYHVRAHWDRTHSEAWQILTRKTGWFAQLTFASMQGCRSAKPLHSPREEILGFFIGAFCGLSQASN